MNLIFIQKSVFSLLMLLFTSFIFSQSNNDKARAYFTQAKSAFATDNYTKTIEYLSSAEDLLGATNPVILNLKIKSYYNLKQYDNAKKALDKFSRVSSKADSDLVEETLSYIVKIDDGIAEEKASKAREVLAEIQRKEDASLAAIKKVEEAKQAEINRKKYIIEQKEICRQYRKEYYKINKSRFYPISENSNLIMYFQVDFRLHMKNIKVPSSIYEDDIREDGFIDFLGNVVFTKKNFIESIPKKILDDRRVIIDFYSSFEEGTCEVKLKSSDGDKNYVGCVNLKGDFTHWENEYDIALASYNGFIRVRKDMKWGLINQKGKLIIPLQYKGIEIYSEGLVCVQNEKGKCGFVNLNNELVIPYDYYPISSSKPYNVFIRGKALVLSGRKRESVYIDKNGEKIK